MNVADWFARFGHRIAAWPTHRKILLAFAITVFLIELAFRRFGRKSKAYKRWTAFFEAIGAVWSAVILSVIYVVGVGPISLFRRFTSDDPLDRSLAKQTSAWRAHEPNPLGPEAAARHQF